MVLEGAGGADEPWEALSAAGARDQAELGLGEPQLSFLAVAHYARVTGERDLETSAECDAVNRCNDRLHREDLD